MLSRDAAAGDTARSLMVALTSGRWPRGSRALGPILASAVLAAACGDSPDTPVVPEVPVPARVLVSPDAISMTALEETREVTAQVFDLDGRVIAGQEVTWAGSPSAVVAVQTRGASALITAVGTGEATVTAQAGTVLGHVAVMVTQVPASLEKADGDGQEALQWSVLPVQPTVYVLDANRHLVDGATVEFVVTEGGGSTDPELVVAVDGKAGTIWTLGAEGPQALTARAGQASVQFTAAALPEEDPSTLAITTSQLTAAHETFEYADTLEATRGRLPYVWSLVEGQLPQGLTLADDGVIRGMASSPGQSSFVVQVRDAAGDEATATFEMTVCGPPLDLELGEVHFTTGIAPGGCGFSVRAASAGSYYRMTLVGQSASWQPLGSVEVRVRGHMPVNAVAVRNAVAETSTWLDPRSRLVAARREAEEDGHLRLRREEALLLAHLTREGRLRALPDRRDRSAAISSDPPPERLVFRLGSPGTVTDNCTVATRTATVLQGYNDHLAIYAEPIPNPPLESASVAVLLRHYERYGAEVIDGWGGVADVDGNGRINVYLDANMPEGISGLVWVGDMLPTSVCPASNAGELMRLERSWVEHFARVLASTLVHEAQHINSVYKRLLNTLEDPFAYDAQHDGWIEEGRAVLAEEEASRLAWAELGGPAPYQQATAAHIEQLSETQEGVSGIFNALSRIKYVLRED